MSLSSQLSEFETKKTITVLGARKKPVVAMESGGRRSIEVERLVKKIDACGSRYSIKLSRQLKRKFGHQGSASLLVQENMNHSHSKFNRLLVLEGFSGEITKYQDSAVTLYQEVHTYRGVQVPELEFVNSKTHLEATHDRFGDVLNEAHDQDWASQVKLVLPPNFESEVTPVNALSGIKANFTINLNSCVDCLKAIVTSF